MKHFHIGDEKKSLAHEIYNLTNYLQTCEKERKEKLTRISNEPLSFTKVQELSKQIKNLQKEIEKTEFEISTLQKKHDAL